VAEPCAIGQSEKFLCLTDTSRRRTLCLRPQINDLSLPRLTMAKAKKTRKFAATKRLLNTTKDTRLQAVKSKVQKTEEKKKDNNGELVREMYFIQHLCLADQLVLKSLLPYSFNIIRPLDRPTESLSIPIFSTFPFKTRSSPSEG
jgi:hypothetical protein